MCAETFIMSAVAAAQRTAITEITACESRRTLVLACSLPIRARITKAQHNSALSLAFSENHHRLVVRSE